MSFREHVVIWYQSAKPYPLEPHSADQGSDEIFWKNRHYRFANDAKIRSSTETQ